MDGCIKYVCYKLSEVPAVFLSNPLFFSRSSQLRAQCPGQPDVVTVKYEERLGGERSGRGVTITAEIHQHTAIVNKVLEVNGFMSVSTGAGRAWRKRLLLPAGEGQYALDVLRRLQNVLDSLVASLPLCLYATLPYRRLHDYLWVMSEADTISRWELAELAGFEAGQERVDRESAMPGAGGYNVTWLADGRWATWIDGDEYIPLFATEAAAQRFAANRRRLCGQGSADFKAPKHSAYELAPFSLTTDDVRGL